MSDDEVLNELIHQRYLQWAWMGPAGNVVAAAVWVLAIAPAALNVQQRIIWMSIAVAVCALMTMAFVVPMFEQSTDSLGIPRLATFSLLLMGLLWGSTLWLLGMALSDPTYTYGTLAVLFGVGSGSMVASSGAARLTGSLLLPTWLGATTALLANELIFEVIGLVALALFTVPAQRDSAAGIRELILLRLASDAAAYIDPLSQLRNRRGLEAALDKLDPGAPVGVVFADLDLFKQINDRHGHDVGDMAIVEVGNLISEAAPSNAIVARFGGDEFVVVSPGDTVDACNVRRRISDSLSATVRVGKLDIAISASCGGAHGQASEVLSALITRADRHMLAEKAAHHRASIPTIDVRAPETDLAS